MKVLVDTNVLVRSVERGHPWMHTSRNVLNRLYRQGDELCLTPQNIAEFSNVCTRPIKLNGLGNSVAATDRLSSRIERFFTILPDSIETFREWRKLLVAHEVKGVKVHDARIVAAMPVHRISKIVTFNVQDFTRFDGIEAVHP